jgi:hypothetical protein
MMPFYLWTSPASAERTFYVLLPTWRAWFKAQPLPACNAVQIIIGFDIVRRDTSP